MFSYCETVLRTQLPTPYALRRTRPRTCPLVSEVTLSESQMCPPGRGHVGRVAVAAWRKCTPRKREMKALKTAVAPPSPCWDFAWLHQRLQGGAAVWPPRDFLAGCRLLGTEGRSPFFLRTLEICLWPPPDLTIPGADFRITWV